MRFRFRLGPLTFGRGGTRLSLWKRGSGVSIPLTGKGRTFGKVGAGPVSGFFGGKSTKKTGSRGSKTEIEYKQPELEPHEISAINAFGSDQRLRKRIQKYGVPWRGVQERIKEELPENLSDRDKIAFQLVPVAMDAVFGQQNTGWKTEKRPSKSGKGLTTWVVIV